MTKTNVLQCCIRYIRIKYNITLCYRCHILYTLEPLNGKYTMMKSLLINCSVGGRARFDLYLRIPCGFLLLIAQQFMLSIFYKLYLLKLVRRSFRFYL